MIETYTIEGIRFEHDGLKFVADVRVEYSPEYYIDCDTPPTEHSAEIVSIENLWMDSPITGGLWPINVVKDDKKILEAIKTQNVETILDEAHDLFMLQGDRYDFEYFSD